MSKLSKAEDLDFHYLLTLMQPLHGQKGFSWLPELFSIIGHENLIKLCKFAGGESIKIPTLVELAEAVDSLQWYYDVYIKGVADPTEVPENLKKSVDRIKEVYDAAQS